MTTKAAEQSVRKLSSRCTTSEYDRGFGHTGKEKPTMNEQCFSVRIQWHTGDAWESDARKIEAARELGAPRRLQLRRRYNHHNHSSNRQKGKRKWFQLHWRG